jgi:hypothetical protein
MQDHCHQSYHSGTSRTTEIYTHVAAHRITAIRSPIAGMMGGG